VTIIEGTVLAMGILSGCSLGILGLSRNQKKSLKNKVSQKLFELRPKAMTAWVGNFPQEYLRMETEETLFLIKIIRMNPAHELIITNPSSWCINANPREWKRQSNPSRVLGVEAFRDFPIGSDKKSEKVALIVPNCHNISRYLNESDVELVTMKKKVAGIRFVRFQELAEFLDLVEKK